MNGDRPDPLIPPYVDLRSFTCMDLDVVKMRNSRASSVLTGEQFMAWFLLICASWHQEPAASLPDDDVELAKLAGFGRMVGAWRALKEGALYGWVRCSDGRLYHPVAVGKAAAAWTNQIEGASQASREEWRRVR